jgi:hypothetical protein
MFPIFLSDFKEGRTISTVFQKNSTDFMNICPMVAVLFHADRHTDQQIDEASKRPGIYHRLPAQAVNVMAAQM